ncbi:sensor domain-containing diguanylate cyclase [Rhodoferax saidenbachensis]|uniref:Diguanylate cyclase (GGDEF)-like protein/PAS domain S-box-containing protein n=1 Tax=Rhodoferax saidenbachensis TaxID=1484693 RepID=A0ABU1ZRQ9_9BURK|nr:sensor domain-containing diguanylate cyclase [Rhodoferax saidenbachensis]MDR7308241.1 diguanylate cyclase (GGDEF)-like protein/PAS domain S-box-containing protein [Rhodoferax saidenbachensis]
MTPVADLSVPALPVKRRRLFVVVWIFVSVVVGVFVLTCLSIFLLSAVRAYVEGEGLWSKGQKDALYALTRYTLYAKEVDYTSYQAALAVNQGDRQARIELEKPVPDYAVARAGFLQGRNHADDVDGMVFLFRRFRHLPDIDKAIAIWAAADRHIEQLTLVGERIHAATQAGPLPPEQAQQFLAELQAINDELTPLEDNFSYTLGEAARKYTLVILLVVFVAALLMLTLAYWASRRLLLQFELTQEALRKGEEQVKSVLQFAPLPIVIVRLSDEAVMYVNDRMRTEFGLGDRPMKSFRPRDFYVNSADRDQLITALQATGRVSDLELLLKDAHGKVFWALYSSQRIRFGGHECVMTALLNVDERKRTHDELRYRAYHDALTGLPNRAMFMDALKRTLHRMERSEGVTSLLFIDLDHFKSVNDRLGHETGDLLLQQVAQRIEDCVREGDLVARLGGDEFVVLVEGHDDANRMAEKILSVLRPEYQLGDHAVNVTASIGVSCFPQDGTELNGLLSAADFAMYQAKTLGRDGVQFYARPQ